MTSQCGYLLLIALICTDKKANKKSTTCIFMMGLSFFLSNLLAVSILYILKGDYAVNFLNTYIDPAYARAYQSTNNSFRYPGVFGDPNYMGFFSLLLSSLFFIKFKNFKNKILLTSLFAVNQVFPFLGQSKNYFIAIIIIALICCIYLCIKVKFGIYIVGICVCLALFAFVAFNNIFMPVIQRILYIDTRIDFLDSLTTGRTTLQANYLSELFREPTTFIFGKGIWESTIDNSSCAHNCYIMLPWYFGILGSIPYLLYFLSFVNINDLKADKKRIVFISIILFFALSLDFITNSIVYIFAFAIYGILEDEEIQVEDGNLNKQIEEEKNMTRIEFYEAQI